MTGRLNGRREIMAYLGIRSRSSWERHLQNGLGAILHKSAINGRIWIKVDALDAWALTHSQPRKPRR